MEIKRLIEKINLGNLDNKFMSLYCTKDNIDVAKTRYVKLLEGFKNNFKDESVQVYSAPGRLEIGGNHTDHQQGKVLACSVNMDIVAVVAPRDDMCIEIISEGFEIRKIDLRDIEINKSFFGKPEGLVLGVASGIKNLGFIIGGFSAYMNSTVLGGAGLSSSAALEVLIGNILSGLYNDMLIPPIEIAKIGQFAENIYFGKPCGLMDQMASSVGGFVKIDFKDKNNPTIEKIEFDFNKINHKLCVVYTGGSHADLTDDYESIRNEMKAVSNFYDKEVLRDCEEGDFVSDIGILRKNVGDRAILRSLHIFEENKRVDKEVEALKNGDFEEFKRLIKNSGFSSFMYLQNVYSIKNYKEQGVSLGLCIAEKVLDDKGAYRVHGGGFGGTIQAFVPDEKIDNFIFSMEAVFGKGSCSLLNVRQIGGVKVF